MRAVQLRGEPRTMACPQCHAAHGIRHRVDGVPLLVCPSQKTPPGVFVVKFGPEDRGGHVLCYLVAPEGHATAATPPGRKAS